MSAGRAFRRLVMDRIITEVPQFNGNVFDWSGRDVPFPYVTLGPSEWRDDSDDCIVSAVITLQIDIWHSEASKGELEDLTRAVARCLLGWEAEELAMHPVSLGIVRIMDDPDGTRLHGIVQVEAMIEEPHGG